MGIYKRIIILVGVLVCFSSVKAFEETPRHEWKLKHPWNLSLGGGWRDYEGDETVGDSSFIALQVEYDMSARLTFMGALGIFPEIEGRTHIDFRTGEEANKLEDEIGEKSTEAVSFSIEALYHLSSTSEDIDPYLVGSVGMMHYSDEFSDVDEWEPNLTAGA